MSAGIGDAVDEDYEGMCVYPPILRAYELAKKREAYIACQGAITIQFHCYIPFIMKVLSCSLQLYMECA